MGRNVFRDGDAAYVSLEYGQELRQHYVTPGDVLIAGLGDESYPLGRAVLAPVDLGPAIVKADCYRARFGPAVTHEFMAWYLSSPHAEERIRLLSRGSTRARLNTEVVREVPVPLLDVDKQGAVVKAWASEAAHVAALATNCAESLALLQERKRALITAAVTGEFELSSAGPRAAAAVTA